MPWPTHGTCLLFLASPAQLVQGSTLLGPCLQTEIPFFHLECPCLPTPAHLRNLQAPATSRIPLHLFLPIPRLQVRYLLRCYYRVRLHKIEEYAMHILDTAEVKERLSDREDAHAQEFFMLQGTHLKMAVGRQLPEAFSSLVRQAAAHPEKDMVPRPDLDKHVFCRVLEDRGQVPVDDAGCVVQG